MKGKFKNTQNQMTFNQYQELKTEGGMSSASINQYRSACYALERELVDNDFSALTVEDIKHAKEKIPAKKNHINGFVLDTFINDMVEYRKDVVLACMGEKERKVFGKLIK